MRVVQGRVGTVHHAHHKGYSDFVQQLESNEKGHTANVALWMNSFFNHEENQYSPDLDYSGSANLGRDADLLIAYALHFGSNNGKN